MKYLAMLSIFLALPVQAAKNCALDGTAGLTPLYGQTIVDTGSINPGDVLMSLGESNTNQIFKELNRNDISLHQGASGGCAIGAWARGSSRCWNNVTNSATHVWIKPVNRARDISSDAYSAQIKSDITSALQQINSRLPNIKEVWISAHHATPYSTPGSKQGEPYSFLSGSDFNVPAGLSFTVRKGPYLWANANTPRADGLTWPCSDFSDDGVHLSSVGNKKAAGLLNDYIDNAMGGEPDPDPVPAPESCLDRVANNDPDCRINWRGLCQCR